MISSETTTQLSKGSWTTKFRSNGKKYPVTIKISNGRFYFHFRYNKNLLQVVKDRFAERRWHPDSKTWSAPINERNLFQIDFLTGHNPYEPWEQEADRREEIERFVHERNQRTNKQIKLFPHQIDMLNFALVTGRNILAAEMGLGKTLTAIILLEMRKHLNVVWVAPNAPLAQAKNEFRDWESPIRPRFLTFMGCVNWVKQYQGVAPRAFVLDESAYVKNYKAQRTQAAAHVAQSIRNEWGFESSILLLTGKADPKAPTDWHAQCEVVQPGFIAEGHVLALQERLGLWEQDPDLGFRKLITWFDDSSKCKFCGQLEGHPNHENDDFEKFLMQGSAGEQRTHTLHKFEPTINEVEKLGKRMKGLVKVWRKEDCLELPPRKFFLKMIEPTQDTLNTAKRLVETTTRAADVLLQLRMLSDGFRYINRPTGEKETCPSCNGEGQLVDLDEDGETIEAVCGKCDGEGTIDILERETEFFESPKTNYFRELLELHYEAGKFVTYGAFQASTDILRNVALSQNWQVLQADGRGWFWYEDQETITPLKKEQMLDRFQKGKDRVCFVGQPGAAGSGITLHASPSVFFYSNSTNPNDRFQAADRIHRIGMSEKGGNIYDVIHLPSDKTILMKLKESKKLSEITIRELRSDYGIV